eukprot:6952251-Pyramimonas_sp.AAC.1
MRSSPGASAVFPVPGGASHNFVFFSATSRFQARLRSLYTLMYSGAVTIDCCPIRTPDKQTNLRWLCSLFVVPKVRRRALSSVVLRRIQQAC